MGDLNYRLDDAPAAATNPLINFAQNSGFLAAASKYYPIQTCALSI